MITLRNLYTAFGHDPKWGRLATQSAQPMVSVFMRKLGDRERKPSYRRHDDED